MSGSLVTPNDSQLVSCVSPRGNILQLQWAAAGSSTSCNSDAGRGSTRSNNSPHKASGDTGASLLACTWRPGPAHLAAWPCTPHAAWPCTPGGLALHTWRPGPAHLQTPRTGAPWCQHAAAASFPRRREAACCLLLLLLLHVTHRSRAERHHLRPRHFQQQGQVAQRACWRPASPCPHGSRGWPGSACLPGAPLTPGTTRQQLLLALICLHHLQRCLQPGSGALPTLLLRRAPVSS